ATAEADVAKCQAAAASLLGLGPGLTPAGDDLLVGWASALWTGGSGSRRLLGRVRPPLLEAARRRTTALSRAFLAAALEGAAAAPLGQLARRPGPGTLAAVLQMGATSGSDCLAGYCLAWTALRQGLVALSA